MIFYFSGTGNSYAAALQLELRLKEKLYNITDCVQNDNYQFPPSENEVVGIICPVYYAGLPSIVTEFLSKLEIKGNTPYIFGVLTYGGTLGAADGMLEKELAKKGYALSACWHVKMPANYAILYEPTNEEAAEPILDAAGDQLEKIIALIAERKKLPLSNNPVAKLLTKTLYPRYDKARITKHFYTNEQCVSCGICAGRCPVKAIELIDGTPTWIKDKCVFCMSCVRCNAIQYGNKMTGRYRYRHPIFQKKKKAADACH